MNDAIIPIVLFVVLGIISGIRAGSMFPLMMGIGFLLGPVNTMRIPIDVGHFFAG